MKLSTREISLLTILAAFYYLSSLLPGVPIIGIPEPKIELEATIASIFGIIVGPYLGFLAGLVGAVTAWILPPGSTNPLSAPFILCPAVNALVTGFIFKNSKLSTQSLVFRRGGVIALAILGTLNIVFWITPPCQPIEKYYYVGLAASWDKIIALLLIVPTILIARKFSSSLKGVFTFFFLLAFIGNQADAALGNFIFALPFVYEGIYQLNLEIVRWLFLVSPFYYPAVRIFQALLAAFLAVPLVRALKSRGWTI